jgi:uncharacterized membrane protein YgcG
VLSALRRCALILLVAAALSPASAAAEDSGWSITSFESDIKVQSDSSIAVHEVIQVDFGALQKHGIFRDIPVRYDYDSKHDRVYRITVLGVSDGKNHAWTYDTSDQGVYREIKIGDPNRTVSGRQVYVIDYQVEGALNSFSDHDELYWNVNGSQWPVPTTATGSVVSLPPGSLQKVTCYQGPTGSNTPCTSSVNGDQATFRASGRLDPGEQLTLVTAINKGAVTNPAPILVDKPRDFGDYFAVNPLTVGLSLLVLLVGLGLVGFNWLRNGRDQVALDVHYIESSVRPRPLFSAPTVIAEFEPPGGLGPAEVGTLLDERADTKDVTATIIDLAGRGFLRIDPLPAQGLGGQDWQLTSTATAEQVAKLKRYESSIFVSLFSGGSTTKLSDLRGQFSNDLHKAEDLLYKDARAGGWFVADPRITIFKWVAAGAGVAAVGIAAAYVAGLLGGAGLVGTAVIPVGVALGVSAAYMPRRTPIGSQLLQHALGFRLYLRTAETYRQQFAEKENLFTSFLPYAIVFGCVDRWAKAFAGLENQPAQTAWYGTGGWQALALSQSIQDFNSHLGQSLAAPPPSAGGAGSGFSGGFSGGGGGGGGGGSW